jgi:hypothetical protein
MKERLQEYALIAEIVSAVAIVLSLIFVGLQVRQSSEQTAANSRALEATVRESMLNADLSILQAALPYVDMQSISGPTTEEEVSRQRNYNSMMGRTRENYWKQHQNGMLDEETYLSYRETFLRLLSNSDFALDIWNTNGIYLVPGFVDEINAELHERGRIRPSVDN